MVKLMKIFGLVIEFLKNFNKQNFSFSNTIVVHGNYNVIDKSSTTNNNYMIPPGQINKIRQKNNTQWYKKFLNHIREGNIDEFAKELQELAIDMFSYHDVSKKSGKQKPENFYHAFSMGLIASLRDEYYIESNKESGLGRFDLAIIPKTKSKNPAIIFEFKSAKDDTDKTLKETTQEALEQINMQQYEAAITKFNPISVLKVGIAFYGKKIIVHYKN